MKAVCAASLTLLLGLSGCATAPRVEVMNRGAAPAAGRAWTYQLVLSNVGERQGALGAAISRRLQQAHLTPMTSTPDLLVEGVYSRRPGVMGAYSDTPKAEADWLDRPVRRRWWQGAPPALQTVGIVLLDARSGQELYRATAIQVLGRHGDGLDVAALVDAALRDGPTPLPAGP
jgi:hypothetical protein